MGRQRLSPFSDRVAINVDTYLREVAGKFQTCLMAILSAKGICLPMTMMRSGKTPARRNSVPIWKQCPVSVIRG